MREVRVQEAGERLPAAADADDDHLRAKDAAEVCQIRADQNEIADAHSFGSGSPIQYEPDVTSADESMVPCCGWAARIGIEALRDQHRTARCRRTGRALTTRAISMSSFCLKLGRYWSRWTTGRLPLPAESDAVLRAPPEPETDMDVERGLDGLASGVRGIEALARRADEMVGSVNEAIRDDDDARGIVLPSSTDRMLAREAERRMLVPVA